MLELAGAIFAFRFKKFDFVFGELRARGDLDKGRNGKVRVPLQIQPDDMLAFAGVLDDSLQAIVKTHALPMSIVRKAYVLQRKPDISPAY